MDEKINLDFFGEVISIPIQKDLASIRHTISTKFFLMDSDAQEIILYYLKGNERIILVKEEDYKIFLKENSKNIFLDISHSSQIYKKNMEELKSKELNEELEKLYKKREEYKIIKETKFQKEIKEIEKIKNEIKKLKLKKKEIKMYINEQMDKINEEKEQNEKKIKELEIKLYGNKIKKAPINKNEKKNNSNKNKKKESKKLSYLKELENLVEEKKKELENFANSIKENLLIKNDNNSIVLKSKPKKNLKLKAPAPQEGNLFDYKCYVNREISWINFNFRVLNESKDPNIPILERIKFCAITSSNMDEFFMVRVASLQDAIDSKEISLDIAGLTQYQQLEKIKSSVKDIITIKM